MTTYPEHIFNWIDATDPDQVKWALNYLRKKGKAPEAYPGTTDRDAFELIMFSTQHWSINTLEYYKLVERMKGTWSKRKSRAHQKDKEGKKPYNFVLRTRRMSELDKLAEDYGLSPSETLERIMDDYCSERQNLRKEVEQKIAKLKEKHTQEIDKLKSQPLLKRLYSTQNEIKALRALHVDELQKQCEYLVLLEDHKLNKEILTPDQQERALEILKKKTKEITKKVAAKIFK